MNAFAKTTLQRALFDRNLGMIACHLPSAVGLLILGAGIILEMYSILRSQVRQVLSGLGSAAVAFHIGRVVGISIGE